MPNEKHEILGQLQSNFRSLQQAEKLVSSNPPDIETRQRASELLFLVFHAVERVELALNNSNQGT